MRAKELSKRSTKELELQVKAAKRLLAIGEAKEHLLPFARFMMPDLEDPDDPDKSQYSVQPHHKLLAEALEKVEQGECLRLAISIPPQHGKLVADDTPVLTSQGWTVHGALKVGDVVYGPDGAPTRIVAVSPPGEASLEVEFTDHSVVKVHPRHEWTLEFCGDWRTLETEELRRRKVWRDGRGNGASYFVHAVPRVEGCEKLLSIHPYVLGAWLGDGTTTKACFTHAPTDVAMVDAVAGFLGYQPTTVCTHATTGVLTTYFSGPFRRALRGLGLLGRKHIPAPYLVASIEQRLWLLAGLIDTDGSVVHRTRRVTFSNTNKEMIGDVARLVRSLGWRATISATPPKRSTSGVQGKLVTYQCTFSPDLAIPTQLPRKRLPGFKTLRRMRGVRAVRPCAPVPGKCIQVDRADGLYCVGEHLIPTHNSLIASRLFPAWYVGRKAQRKVIFATYSQDFAQEFGGDVRTIMLSPQYKSVFPKTVLKTGSKAKDLLSTTDQGRLAFIGRGGAGTGKSADLVIIDDPLKNSEEAESPTVRKQLHDWFDKVIYSRARVTTAIIIIQTRWHEDDLIGRLCDPEHPEHDPTLAREWTYINVPAVVTDSALADALEMTLEAQTEPSVTEAFGSKPMAPLWPAQFTLKHLASAQRLNRQSFNALYMGRPSPEDGEYFKKDWMIEYTPEQLPKNLRYYGASDHAAGEKQQNDPSVIGCIGVDRDDNIWILPDVVWEKMETDRTVEELLHQMRTHKPLLWWMESELISKSFGPFLRKRMVETKTYCTIDPQVPSRDKRIRARAIQGRMSMHKLRFPKWAPWWRDAQSQLLKFPFGTNDDFVDWLSWVGLGLTKEIAATNVVSDRNVVRVGSFAWVKAESRRREQAETLKKLSAGW